MRITEMCNKENLVSPAILPDKHTTDNFMLNKGERRVRGDRKAGYPALGDGKTEK